MEGLKASAHEGEAPQLCGSNNVEFKVLEGM